jgi:hypothetical protein
MPWIITKDLIGDPAAKAGTNQNAVGLMGPRDYAGDGSELIHKFHLVDDDGEIYYEGRSGDDSDFGPLDDFGKPNAGATAIQYWVEGVGWRDL